MIVDHPRAARPRGDAGLSVAQKIRPAPVRHGRTGADTGVLVIGNYRPTVAVVRSLGRAGFRVIVGREPNGYVAELSRYAAEAWDHPSLVGRDTGFLEALICFLERRPDIEVLFPVSGAAIMALCRARDRLPEHIRLAMPEPAAVEACDHKTKLLEVAKRLGIPHPAFALASGAVQLKCLAGDIGYPCIVKPALAERRLFGQKAVIFYRPADLDEAFRTWPEEHDSLLVQRYLPGVRYNLHMAARGGRVLRCVTSISLRTQSPDGTGLTVQAISVETPDDLRVSCERLLRHLNYTGIACVQFLVDQRSGSSAFLEVNPRLAASCAIAQYCGLDLPVLAVELARGTAIPELDERSGYRIGCRYAWTYGDLEGLKRALVGRCIGPRQALGWLTTATGSLLRADTHATWSWSDPRPALTLYTRLLTRAGGQRRAGRQQKVRGDP